MKNIALMVVLFVMSACGRGNFYPSGPQAPEAGMQNAIASAVRLRIYCDGEMLGWGSGTFIDPWHVITARHVSCDENPVASEYDVVNFWGETKHATYDAGAEDSDTDVLRLLVSEQNGAWAEIANYIPAYGQEVYMSTGDGTMDEVDFPAFHFKVGRVGPSDESKVRVNIHCVPGNSGGAWFDAQGHLLGVLSAGSWNSGRENWCEGYPPASWMDLIQTP